MFLTLFLSLFLHFIPVITVSGQDLYQDDIVGCSTSRNPACPLQISKPLYYKVEGTVFIPYAIDQSLESLRDDILAALGLVSDETKCIKFIATDSASDQDIPNIPQVRFMRGKRCSSQFDQSRTPVHTVFLNEECAEVSKIQQLLMLALGFPHEISRNDREDHVIINWDNIATERKAELNKNDPGVFDNLPYDYDSLLHPDYQFLAQTNTAPTLIPKDPKHKIGQRQRLSAGDIAKLKNVICAGSTSRPPRPKPTPPVKKPEDNTPKVVTVTVTVPTPAAESSAVSSQKCRPDDEDCEQANPASGIQPTLALPLAHCSIDQNVVMQNTQTMSRTLINGMETVYKDSTRRSTWWFQQNAAGATKDYLAQSVEFKGFTGITRTVTTKAENKFTKILQTAYEPSVSFNGETVLQQKIETRVMQCQ